MTRTAKLAIAGTFIAASLFSVGAHAASVQVFTNFGPKLTFDHSIANIQGANGPNGFLSTMIATPFTLTNSINLDHIDVAISDESCGTSLAKGYIVDIVSSNGVKPGKNVFAHWLETKALSYCGTVKATKLAVKPTVTVTMPAGTYWVVLTVDGYDGFNYWFGGLTNGTGIGTTSYSSNGGSSYSSVSQSVSTALDIWRR